MSIGGIGNITQHFFKKNSCWYACERFFATLKLEAIAKLKFGVASLTDRGRTMYYVNGEYVAADAARMDVTDLGIIRGFGVFDYLRTYGGRPFHFQDHLERLRFSAKMLGLELKESLEEITMIVEKLLADNSYPESAVKIIATGGLSLDQFFPVGYPSLIVMVYPLQNYPEVCYEQGIYVATTTLQRSLPWVKTLYYTPAIVAMQQGKKFDAQEILYLNKDNEVLEAATCNFFAVQGHTIVTTPDSAEILIGITRNVVLNLAQKDFIIEKRMVSIEELKSFDEAFITSSTREVMPVVKIDGNPVGKGVVGAVTKEIMYRFANYAQSQKWPALDIPRHQKEIHPN